MPLMPAARRVAATDAAARAASVDVSDGIPRDEGICIGESTRRDGNLPVRGSNGFAGRRLEMDLVDLRDALPELRRDTRRLQDWLHWRGLVAKAEARGLAPLCAALEAGEVEDAEDAFNRAYAVWWTPLAIDAADPLRTFIGWKHQRRIEAFRKPRRPSCRARRRERPPPHRPRPAGCRERRAQLGLGPLTRLDGPTTPRASRSAFCSSG